MCIGFFLEIVQDRGYDISCQVAESGLFSCEQNDQIAAGASSIQQGCKGSIEVKCKRINGVHRLL